MQTVVLNDDWKRFGLSIDMAIAQFNPPSEIYYLRIFSDTEVQEYITKVSICHDFVTGFLIAHPDEGKLFLEKEPGHLYFDILEKASPEYSRWASEWSKELSCRLNKAREADKKITGFRYGN